ncbi:MAG TPA: tetratricopeptide repeat protein [Bryobacteraceae bacterium]|jgi:tetratricopeptide (TPR) repeat protein
MNAVCEAALAHDEVLRQLERILADKRFAAAERTATFLRYVVEKTLAGCAAEIKEMVIATDLYGRLSNYDPKIDSMVRVEATRLRSKLTDYYREQGSRDPVAITIPKGSYVPQFDRREPQAAALGSSVVSTISMPAIEAPRWQLRRWGFGKWAPWMALAGLCVLAICLVARPARSKHPEAATEPPEALAAWEEGNALLAQDPHSGSFEQGAPQILLRAIERYEYAVAQAPSFASAWASLAEAYEYAFPYVGRDAERDAQRAEAAARRAVALDDKLGIAHANLALVLFYLRWDLAGAEKEYRRAIRLDSHLVYAIVEFADLLRETGRWHEAELELRKARADLPALPVLAWKQAEVLLDRHRMDDSIASAKSALRLKRDYGRAYVALGSAYEANGQFSAALEQYRAALAIDGQDRRALPAFGYLLGRLGQKDEAQSVLQKLITMNAEVRNCAFQVAVVYAGLSDYDRALDWLERAATTHQMHVPFMAVEPRFEPLRSSQRFRALLARVGLRIAS